MRLHDLFFAAAIAGLLLSTTGRAAQAQRTGMVALAWAPIDDAAERLFRRADSANSGFLSLDQFKTVEPKLNDSILDLARRGALVGLPPNALNAQSYGVTLPGATEVSRPEFVLEARSRTSKLLRRMPQLAGMPGQRMPGPFMAGPGMPRPGMQSGHPHRKSPARRKPNDGPRPSPSLVDRADPPRSSAM